MLCWYRPSKALHSTSSSVKCAGSVDWALWVLSVPCIMLDSGLTKQPSCSSCKKEQVITMGVRPWDRGVSSLSVIRHVIVLISVRQSSLVMSRCIAAERAMSCLCCRKHFIQVTSTPEAAAVRTRRDGVLWLWRAHNEVNARLQKVGLVVLHRSVPPRALGALRRKV